MQSINRKEGFSCSLPSVAFKYPLRNKIQIKKLYGRRPLTFILFIFYSDDCLKF